MRPTPPLHAPMALTGSAPRRATTLVWRAMRAEPVVFAIAVLAAGAFGALSVGVASAVGWATDEVLVPAVRDGDTAARGRWWEMALVLVGVAVLLAVTVALRRVVAGMGFAFTQAHHRRRVTRRLAELPVAWHRRHPAGRLLANAHADVEAATGIFNPLPFALGVVVMIGVALVALLTIDGWITLAAAGMIPVLIGANLAFQRTMTPVASRAQQLRGEVSDVAHESFEAALVVAALGTADREEERFAGRADALRDANVRSGYVRAVFDPLVEALPGVGALLVVVVGALRLDAGAVEAGDVVTSTFLLTLLSVPVRAFGWVLGEVPRALVGYDRIARVVDARGELPEGGRALPPDATGPGHLRLEGVTVEVPGLGGARRVLDRVDLDLRPGRTIALVGPTGAGKSTLVAAAVRLLDPVEGRVTLDGVDLRDLASDVRTRGVALVAQQAFVFEDTVRGNITLADPGDPDAPDDEAVWSALQSAQVDDVVRALPDGLDARLGERGASLSGGQRQRLAIARALVREPRVLVLDDATSAVDPAVEQAVLGSLGRAGSRRPTTLLVAYRMSSVLLADEIVHLDAGRVVDRGTHAELLARDPGYADLATAYEVEALRRERERADEESAP